MYDHDYTPFLDGDDLDRILETRRLVYLYAPAPGTEDFWAALAGQAAFGGMQ